MDSFFFEVMRKVVSFTRSLQCSVASAEAHSQCDLFSPRVEMTTFPWNKKGNQELDDMLY